jgi:hypothetical protein
MGEIAVIAVAGLAALALLAGGGLGRISPRPTRQSGEGET